MKFTKMSGAGNDFVLIERKSLPASARADFSSVARKLCDRRRSIGADGLLVLSRERRGLAGALDYYNADGSRAFCGNGSRCAAWWMYARGWSRRRSFRFSSIEGELEAEIVSSGRARVKMPNVRDIKADLKIKAAGRNWTVHSINTGVPHAVILVKHLDDVPVAAAGRAIRHHRVFQSTGTNVDFVEVLSRKGSGAIGIRTYERGVEDETLACGTGITASALCMAALRGWKSPISVYSRGGDRLLVSFNMDSEGIHDIWLEGPTVITFEGECAL